MRWTIIVLLVFTLIVVSLGDNDEPHKCMNCENFDAGHADNSDDDDDDDDDDDNDKEGHMEDRGGRMLAVVIPVIVAIVVAVTVVGCCVYVKKSKQRMTKTNPDCGKGQIMSIAILPDSEEKKPLPEHNYWNPPFTTTVPPTFNYVPAYYSDVKLPPANLPVSFDTVLQPPPPYSKTEET